MYEEVIIITIKNINEKKQSLKFATFLSTLLSIIFAGRETFSQKLYIILPYCYAKSNVSDHLSSTGVLKN